MNNINGLRCSDFIEIRNAQQDKMYEDMDRDLTEVAKVIGSIVLCGSFFLGCCVVMMPDDFGMAMMPDDSTSLFVDVFPVVTVLFFPLTWMLAFAAIYVPGSLWISYKVHLFAKDTDAFRNKHEENLDAVIDMREISVLLEQCSPELVTRYVAA